MRDLIFVSMENWDDVWRRNQFVCAALARRYPQMKLLFVGLTRDFSNRVRRLKFRDDSGPVTVSPAGLPNISFTRPLKLLPNTIPACRWVNQAMFRQHVMRVAGHMGMKNPVLWLNPHYAVHMVGKCGESATVYDITDDWISMGSQGKAEVDLITSQDHQLCRIADATIVCSPKLKSLKEDLSPNLHLIPNGVDGQHYRAVLDDRSPLAGPMSGWAKPVLGYTGTIHGERVDLDLVEALAREFSSGTIALVGPPMISPAERARLEAHKNIAITGAVPYANIPQYMRGFDVCITPHRMTPFTESLNPIKLWEYLAAGKPIVSTDVAGFRNYPQHVGLARNAPEFIARVREALAEDSAKADARRAEAARHSWDSRVDQIEAVTENAIALRAGKSAGPANAARLTGAV